jgi:hypothetical protein
MSTICLGLFLDTEKAFDKICHPGLLYEVKPHLPDTYYKLLQKTYTATYNPDRR